MMDRLRTANRDREDDGDRGDRRGRRAAEEEGQRVADRREEWDTFEHRYGRRQLRARRARAEEEKEASWDEDYEEDDERRGKVRRRRDGDNHYFEVSQLFSAPTSCTLSLRGD